MTGEEILDQLCFDPNIVAVKQLVASLIEQTRDMGAELERLRTEVKELKDKLSDWESRAQELDTLQ